ncbi:hypothetical protein QNH10_13935 [Sporosarcina thermotolerans]|nr:hypothetical protein [Sporosarcina thermotolerans]WHT47301.1 hypothetical protein QNH10_13935 [Sporosarcina thermotolerans]
MIELQREGEIFKKIHKIELIKPNGMVVEAQLVSNRENMLLFLDRDELYMYEAK